MEQNDISLLVVPRQVGEQPGVKHKLSNEVDLWAGDTVDFHPLDVSLTRLACRNEGDVPPQIS